MKRTTITLCAAVLLACNNEKTAEPKVAGASTEVSTPAPDSATAAKNWQEYMTPGPAHKAMAESDGTWNSEVTMWMAPGAQPTTSKAVTENRMVLGGRYQQSVHKGEYGGMPFEGISTLAYDNHKKAYISTWIDNMGTGMMIMEGPWDDATKSVTLKGKMVDPATKKETDVKEIFTLIDKDHQKMEMFAPLENGKEFKCMEINYTRKK